MVVGSLRSWAHDHLFPHIWVASRRGIHSCIVRLGIPFHSRHSPTERLALIIDTCRWFHWGSLSSPLYHWIQSREPTAVPSLAVYNYGYKSTPLYQKVFCPLTGPGLKTAGCLASHSPENLDGWSVLVVDDSTMQKAGLTLHGTNSTHRVTRHKSRHLTRIKIIWLKFWF